MKPWFIREGDVIKFPDPSAKKIVRLPTIDHYTSFIDGVTDLQAQLDDGRISRKIYDKLYTDLIHRFSKKEGMDPWFMKEAPQDLAKLGKQVASLPQDIDPRIIDKIVSALELARQPKGKEVDAYTRVKEPLKKVGEVDDDMKRTYREVAKKMLGNNLTNDEIFKKIIPAIEQNKCINLKELTAPRSDLSKICAYYNNSQQTAFFYYDLCMYQPAQGIGPGEILFSTLSQSIKKGGKGDLTIGTKGVEVKGADEATGSGAGRMRDNDVYATRSQNYSQLAANFLKKFPTTKKIGWSLGKDGVMGIIAREKNIKKKETLENYVIQLFNAVFPGSSYSADFSQAIRNADIKKAHYYYGLSNMQLYDKVKGGQQGYLFVDTSKGPPQTTYVENFTSVQKGLENGILTLKTSAPYIVAKPGQEKEIYPKVSAYPV